MLSRPRDVDPQVFKKDIDHKIRGWLVGEINSDCRLLRFWFAREGEMQLQDKICSLWPRDGKSFRQRHRLPTGGPNPKIAGKHRAWKRDLREPRTRIGLVKLSCRSRAIHAQRRMVNNASIAGPVLDGMDVFSVRNL